jgi:hypothetical protein
MINMVRTLIGLISISLLAAPLFAAQITKIKGRNVLIDLKGDSASVGDSFYAVEADGKRKGLIEVSKVKGDKAIGKIVKGKPATGMRLEIKPAGLTKRGVGDGNGHTTDSKAMKGRAYFGGLFGYARDTMSVNVNSFNTNQFLENVSLSGSGFSGKGLFDYELFKQIWFRGEIGGEMFNASGKARCGTNNTQTCDVKIVYLSFDFLGRYVFSEGAFRPWVGGGVSLLFPASKSTTALDESSIGTTSVFTVAGGADLFLSPTMYIPLQVEYAMLPKSDEVEANWIAFRLGVAVPF